MPNKPVNISATFDDRIEQNAGRMWCLLHLIPQMLGDVVPENDVYWNFLLELKEIVELTFANCLSESHVYLMILKIQDHLSAFLGLFPDKQLLPKHHFMLHYPCLMCALGPLRQTWCMRFESKHSYFTKLAKTINNFINLCYTCMAPSAEADLSPVQ